MAARTFSDYCTALDKLSKAAQLELEEIWLSLDQSDPEAVRDALAEAMVALCAKYGDMAALVAAEYYESERGEAMGGGYRALLAETAPAGQIEASVRYAAGHLFR